MKLSVSLADEDVEFVDTYAERQGVDSRSAVIREAVRLLRAREIGADYAAAWDEWSSDDGKAWDATAADGLNRDE